jgi:hypothetical protein
VEPTVGSAPPWAGVTPAPSIKEEERMRGFAPVRRGLEESALSVRFPFHQGKGLGVRLLASFAALLFCHPDEASAASGWKDLGQRRASAAGSGFGLLPSDENPEGWVTRSEKWSAARFRKPEPVSLARSCPRSFLPSRCSGRQDDCIGLALLVSDWMTDQFRAARSRRMTDELRVACLKALRWLFREL